LPFFIFRAFPGKLFSDSPRIQVIHPLPDPEAKKTMTAAPEKRTISLPEDCIRAVFQFREKRFIIRALKDEALISAHTNNSGSMLGLLRPGSSLVLSPARSPRRKLPYTLELVRTHGFWTGVNTSVPSRMLRLAWKNRLIEEFADYENFIPEARTGKSRLDALLEGRKGRMWVEAKNVTLVEGNKGYFPDAVSTRAARHMEELMRLAGAGYNVACFYLVQRPDCSCFGPADFIDPVFTHLFLAAMRRGLKVLAYGTVVSPSGITLGERLPVQGP